MVEGCKAVSGLLRVVVVEVCIAFMGLLCVVVVINFRVITAVCEYVGTCHVVRK